MFSKHQPLPTMHIRSHPRYSGSGILFTRIITEGPTNILEIDHKKALDRIITQSIASTIYYLDLHFPIGIGISVVGSIGHESEELIYALVHNVHIKYNNKDNDEQFIEATLDTLTVSEFFLYSRLEIN